MSEKRYFKIFSERHTIGGQNKYVLLFNALDKAPTENDEQLKKVLKQKGINTDFLSADKNYLFQLLLRCLNDFHVNKTFNLSVKSQLQQIEILFHKGLYPECLKQIEKAIKQAEECENFPLIIDILMWKKKCAGYSLGLAKAVEANNQIESYITKLENLKRMTDLYYSSNLLQSKHENLSKDAMLKEFKSILKDPLLSSEKQIMSFSAGIYFHLIYANYYYSTNQKEKEFEHLKKLIQVIDGSASYSLENPLDYISIYNRYLNTKKFFPDETFFDEIKHLKKFPAKLSIRKETSVERAFIHAYTHELDYCIINNYFTRALKIVTEIEKELSKISFDIEPYHLINFHYLIAIVLIFCNQYNKALRHLNKALNEFDISARPQVYIRAKILNAIVHFELKNTNLTLNLCKEINQLNKHHQLLLETEIQLLNVITKLSASKQLTLKAEHQLFSDLLSLISNPKNKEIQQAPNLVSNYEKWIEAKLKRRAVSEIYSLD